MGLRKVNLNMDSYFVSKFAGILFNVSNTGSACVISETQVRNYEKCCFRWYFASKPFLTSVLCQSISEVSGPKTGSAICWRQLFATP